MPPSCWTRWVLGCVIALLFISALGVIVLDPCYRYRMPSIYKPFYRKQMFQLPGIMRNNNFSALIIGDSMTNNFNLADIRTIWGEEALKATGNGWRCGDQLLFADYALKLRPGEVKHVIWSVNNWSFNYGAKNPQAIQPEILRIFTDPIGICDIRYFWNADVWSDFMRRVFRYQANKRYERFLDYDMMWAQNNSAREWGLKFVQKAFATGIKPKTASTEESIAAIKGSLLKIVKEHPETHFYFFLPPYSLAFWGNFQGNKQRLDYLRLQEVLTEILACEHNTTVHNLQSVEEIVGDFSIYKDMNHYNPDINTLILHIIKEGKYIQKSGDAAAATDNLLTLLNSKQNQLKSLGLYRE
jgi:hypothetical protein